MRPLPAVEPHAEIDGLFQVGQWAFSLEDEDGDLSYVEEAIAAWTAWRDFIVHKQEAESASPLF